MKLKKMLAAVLTMAMVATALPVTAFAATTLPSAENGVITLTEDVMLEETFYIEGEITLNLNGFTIGEAESWQTGSGNDALLAVKYGGDLTIKDSGSSGAITVNKAYSAVKMTEIGETANDKVAKLTVDGGTLTGKYYAICGNGGRSGTEITINDGALKVTESPWGFGIFHPQNGKLTVTGGTISAPTGIEMRGGELVVTGGKIKSTVSELKTTKSDSGTTVSGAAIALSQHTTNHETSVTVTGGELSGPYAFYQNRLIKADEASTGISAKIGDDAEVEGKVLVDESEMDDIFTVTGGKFTDLAGAVKYAASGATVTLLDDVTLTESIEITDGMDVTIKGNGKTITGAAGKDVFYVEGGKLTLEEGLNVYAPTDCAIYIRGGEVITSANLKKGGEKYSVIQGNGQYTGNVTINGGAITNEIENKCAIYWPQNGKLTINGGTITGGTALRLSSGSLEINGGTLIANGTKQDYVASTGGSVQDTGEAVMIENIGGTSGYEEITSVSITGGTFISENNNAVASYTAGNEEVKAVSGFVSGGAFSNSLLDTDYLDENLKAELNSAGEEAPFSYYTSVENAKDNAKTGDVITAFEVDEETGEVEKGETTTITAPASSSNGGSTSKSYKAEVDEDMENGSIRLSREKAKPGTEVTITVAPDKGYKLDELKVLNSRGTAIDVKDNGDGTFTFKMPKGGVEIEASFVEGEAAPVVPADQEESLVLTINQLFYMLNGKYEANDVAPIIKGDRTMLPIRLIAEFLGATVTWSEAEQSVTIVKDDTTIVIYIGQAFALVNGEPVQLDEAAFIENDRTYLPLRFIAENLGATVVWDGTNNTVTITK